MGIKAVCLPSAIPLRPRYRVLAVTPTKSDGMSFADVTTICSDYTINGLTNMASLAHKPFRFVYTSGYTIERDQTKTLSFLSDYRLMRVRKSVIEA